MWIVEFIFHRIWNSKELLYSEKKFIWIDTETFDIFSVNINGNETRHQHRLLSFTVTKSNICGFVMFFSAFYYFQRYDVSSFILPFH